MSFTLGLGYAPYQPKPKSDFRMVEYRGFVIDQMAVGVWYVRRPGSFLEAMWAPRTETPEQQERAIDRFHAQQAII